jgi:methylated-DNA-protein-cysteine methyltransferase-like protein
VASDSLKDAPLFERIYAVVRQIPAGKVATYGQIARMVGGCSAQMGGFAMAAL